MPKFELEDIDGNVYTEKTRKHLPARLTNECEALYNAKVQASRSSESVDTGDVMKARSEIKNKVISYLNKNDFMNELGPDRISPKSQETILKHYQEYLMGISYKDSENSGGSGKSGSGSEEQE